MNSNTVIVTGNGFDLDLGWRTSYKDFYDAHNGWRMHKTEQDDLFQYMIKCTASNWFDFEKTLFDYAIHRAKIGLDIDLVIRDLQDYKSFKDQLFHFIKERSKEPVRKESFAYRLTEAYIKQRKRYQHNGRMFMNWFSFNYTPLDNVARQIDPNYDFSYIPVHGTIAQNNIIFGIHDDERILPEYRDLQKSMDDNYESHGIVRAMLDSNLIIFFGLSMGFIDSIYFQELFKGLSDIGNSQSFQGKSIFFITKDTRSKKDIKNKLLDMKLQPQILFNMSNVEFIFTSDVEDKANTTKFEMLLSRL